jgi:hypothetical protein
MLDYLEQVVGIYDELDIGEVLDQTTVQDTQHGMVSLGQAVKALVLNGPEFITRKSPDCVVLLVYRIATKRSKTEQFRLLIDGVVYNRQCPHAVYVDGAGAKNRYHE